MEDKFNTPSQMLSYLLNEKGWSKSTFAEIVNINNSVISKIFSNNRPIDAKLAIIFEKVFDVSAQNFLSIQIKYDLARARGEEIVDNKLEKRAYLLGDFPIKEMIKRGWLNIENNKDIKEIEKEICKFFSVKDVEDIKEINHFAKKTDVLGELSPNQLAWLYRVKEISKEILVPKYSKTKLEKAIEDIKKLMLSPKELRQVPRILAESGVRFLVVEALPSSKIDGVSFWLNNEYPVIALTMRFDRIDNFCFVLRHECEHILREDGRNQEFGINIDIEMEKRDLNISEIENLANLAASDFCVPERLMETFIARKEPLFDQNSLLGFARTIGVHPGVVVGQLQKKTGRYNLFRNYLVKIKDYIIPNAYVDGWGNVFPIDK